MESCLALSASVWPFPTVSVQEGTTVLIASLIVKFIEIAVITFYFVDLLPNIKSWKKPLAWKIINALIVGFMVIQIPLHSLSVYEHLGLSPHKMKLKVMQVCVSFLLLLEILSAREENAQPAPKVLSAEERLAALRKDPANTHFTWEEIVEHDKKDDLWVVIYGKVYDLTTFWEKHPGGDIIVDGAGGDCTPTWESYHPLKMAKRGPHQKYWIGMVRDYDDFYNWDGEFYDELKKRVEDKVPHEIRRYDPRMYWKTAVILVLFFATLYWNITTYTWYTAITFALVCS